MWNVECVYNYEVTLTEVFVLALVQGLTEFLPVSSSGHLLVVRLFFGISDIDGTVLDAFLHLGTLAAVLVYYRRVWLTMQRHLVGALLIATVPAALSGYFLQDTIDALLRGPRVLAVSFLFTALVLWWFDRVPTTQHSDKERVSFADALTLGLAQILALVPAVSRSGITIAAGLARGLGRQQATTFSFLMSVPIIAGASLSSLKTLVENGSFSGQLLLVGTVVSFVSGLLAIYLLLRLIERMSFRPFVIYLIGLAAVVWIAA